MISGAFFLVATRIDTLSNMCGLTMQQIGDFHRLMVKFVLFVADVFDTGSRNIFYLFKIVLEARLV